MSIPSTPYITYSVTSSHPNVAVTASITGAPVVVNTSLDTHVNLPLPTSPVDPRIADTTPPASPTPTSPTPASPLVDDTISASPDITSSYDETQFFTYAQTQEHPQEQPITLQADDILEDASNETFMDILPPDMDEHVDESQAFSQHENGNEADVGEQGDFLDQYNLLGHIRANYNVDLPFTPIAPMVPYLLW